MDKLRGGRHFHGVKAKFKMLLGVDAMVGSRIKPTRAKKVVAADCVVLDAQLIISRSNFSRASSFLMMRIKRKIKHSKMESLPTFLLLMKNKQESCCMELNHR